MADLPAGTDRATLVLVQTKDPIEGHDSPTQFVVGAGYLAAFGDEVEFVRFAEETADAAEERESKAAAAEKAASKATASSGSSSRGSDGFA